MNKNFTEDSLFKTLWAEGRTLDLEAEEFASFTAEDVYDILNLIKASLISNISFTQCYQHVYSEKSKGNDKEVLKVLTFKLAFKHLVAINDSDILSLSGKRDFIAEVAAQKYNLPLESITGVEKKELLGDSDEVYSITDPPVDSWDEYFYNVCRQAARNSKCLSRRIGAVLVKDKSIISTGYNSPPRGVPSCDRRWTLDPHFIAKYEDQIIVPIDHNKPMCPRKTLGAKSGEMLDICPAGHAEENAILNAAWHGISTKGSTLFMTCGIPCFRCIIKIINAGISEIVVTGISFYDDNAEFLLNNSDVKVRFYDFEKKT